jgi:hypothetical protein
MREVVMHIFGFFGGFRGRRFDGGGGHGWGWDDDDWGWGGDWGGGYWR